MNMLRNILQNVRHHFTLGTTLIQNMILIHLKNPLGLHECKLVKFQLFKRLVKYFHFLAFNIIKMKLLKTLQLILFGLIYISITTCISMGDRTSRNESSNNEKRISTFCQEYSFAFDSLSVNSFAKKYYSGDLPISPSSITILGNNIYIVDVYHNNVKRFNLESKNLYSSLPISEKRIWLYDIIAFNDKIYVTSETDSIYIFSPELILLNKLFLNKGKGLFFKSYDDSLIVSYSADKHKFVTLNKKGEVVNISYGYRNKSNLAHGKYCERKNKSYHVNTSLGLVQLEKEYEFEGINLDYDNSKLVFFNTDSNNLYLYICYYKSL